MRRSASLYRRGDQVIVCANHRTSDGLPLDAEPFVMLTEPVTAPDVGKAVLEALRQFRELEGKAPENRDFLAFFAELAGVESYRVFMAGARFCAIEENGGVIAFHPMANDEGSFDPVAAVATISIGAASEAIGRAALGALAKAR